MKSGTWKDIAAPAYPTNPALIQHLDQKTKGSVAPDFTAVVEVLTDVRDPVPLVQEEAARRTPRLGSLAARGAQAELPLGRRGRSSQTEGREAGEKAEPHGGEFPRRHRSFPFLAPIGRAPAPRPHGTRLRPDGQGHGGRIHGGQVPAVRAAGFPADISDAPGTLVCNHLMYGVLQHIAERELPIRAGWIHLPALPNVAALESNLGMPSMTVETSLAGVQVGIRAALAHREDIREPIRSVWQI